MLIDQPVQHLARFIDHPVDDLLLAVALVATALAEALKAGGSDESAIRNFQVASEKKGGMVGVSEVFFLSTVMDRILFWETSTVTFRPSRAR